MPRALTGQDVWKSLNSLTLFKQVAAGGATTLAAAVTAGATVGNFTATTNFTASDPLFIVGASGFELNAIGAAITPSTAVPLLYPTAMANPSGSQLLEAVAAVLGHIDPAGFSFGGTSPLVAINSALQHTPIAYIRGMGELTANFNLLEFNALNLQLMFGQVEDEAGAGTAANPYRAAILGGAIGGQGVQCLRATGTRMDGATILVDFNGALIEPTGQVALTRGAQTMLPCALRFTSLVARIYT
jgi:hypothetical protein